jgi:putative DNA primase/helicase
VIARGHEAHVISGATINPEEFEKKISTVLIAGDAIVAIDNLEGPLGGELLCSATTEAMLSIRVLGVSKAVLVPNSAVFFATGNSMVIVGDMVRRCIRSRLDARAESPELRTFNGGDPVLRAKRDRASLVVAALTVLRAYHVADRPRPSGAPPPLGSFEDWSGLVRDALIWLDQPDPCLTMARAKQDDPRRNALSAVLHTWHAALGEIEVTAKGLIEMAIEQQPGTYNDYNPPAYMQPDLREALIAVAGDRGAFINSTKLGYWLRASKGRVIDRLRIESGTGKDRSGVAVWKVVNV